jgi:uncharacterized protein
MNTLIPKPIRKPIRIRGHHLLCMINWKGVGYTPAFTENYNHIIAQLKTGAVTLEIVRGKDDICAPLTPQNYDGYHCDDEEVLDRDVHALRDINIQLGLDLSIGSQFTLSAQYLSDLRARFQSNHVRTACTGCSWHGFCTNIANDGFKDTKI